MINGLHGKIALVTGGSSGIGRASAAAFARNGVKVVVADIDSTGGEETVKLIHQADGEASFIKTDVTHMHDVEALINQIVNKYDHLDFAFNNAGMHGGRASFTEWSEESWDKIINVNLKSVWLCMKYELLQMVKQGGGVIVNTSSLAGLRGFPTTPIYTASKHGVIGLTKSAALNYAKIGIRVNAICPGPITTPLFTQNISHGDKQFEAESAARVPMGRLGNPEDIAGTVLWLCSNASSFVTGQAIIADGGWAV